MTGGSSENTGYSRASSLKRTSCPRWFWRGADDMLSCVSSIVQRVSEERMAERASFCMQLPGAINSKPWTQVPRLTFYYLS